MYWFTVSVSPMMHLNGSCDKVLSIAFSQTRINVLCDNPQRIFIYDDKSPFNLETSLSLDWMFVPENMVASPSSDHLYVCDSGNACIYMIYREGGSYLNSKWLCDNDVRIRSLSGDGSTILATNMYLYKLMLYNTEYASLFHSFNLPVNTYLELCHIVKIAVKTSTGDFIVSCGSHLDSTGDICKFNKAESMVRCYTPRITSEELTHPIHMSLTSDDQVIVADTWNNRILLLNSDLTWNRVLVTGNNDSGVIKPVLLSYKTDLKLLAVVNFEGNVTVYNSHATGL